MKYTQQDIHDIVLDAPRAVGYWADTVQYDATKPKVILREEGEQGVMRHVVSPAVVRKGIRLIRSGEVQLRADIEASVANGNIDDECMDCIIQAGLFSDLRYS